MREKFPIMRVSLFSAWVLLMLFTSSLIYSQEDTYILYENGYKDVYGYTLFLNNFWVNNGEIKATIEVYRGENDKPVSGGYSVGDALEFNLGAEPVPLYVHEVFKLGTDDLGYVVLSRSRPADTVAYYSDIFELGEGAEREAGNLRLRVVSIRENEALLDMRNIKFDSLLYKNRYPVSAEDTVWLGRAIYRVNSIVNDAVYMSRIFTYIPPGNSIPGEIINAPGITTVLPPGEGHLLMRKMHYFRSKRENPGVIKYCLIRIVSQYEDGVAVARPFVPLKVNGEKIFLPFEFVKTFETEEEALRYAKENNITDVNLSGIEE